MSSARMLGSWGEHYACRWLQQHGLFLVEQNARTPHGELDLVMLEKEEMVFVEVKTRRNLSFGAPEAAVTTRKLAHLSAAVAWYTNNLRWQGTYRLDVVSILVTGTKATLVHLRNIGA